MIDRADMTREYPLHFTRLSSPQPHRILLPTATGGKDEITRAERNARDSPQTVQVMPPQIRP